MSYLETKQKFTLSMLNQSQGSNLGKLYGLFTNQMDQLDGVMGQLRTVLDMATQTEYNLDRIGYILKQGRGGLGDETYRQMLSIAIQKTLSRGDLHTINSIISLLGLKIFIQENEGDDPIYLDASVPLDATQRMSGTNFVPATIYTYFLYDFDTVETSPELNILLDQIRAAGIDVRVNYIIETGLLFTNKDKPAEDIDANTHLYTNYSYELDGTWELDSRKLLLDSLEFDIATMALGNGGEDESGPKALNGSEVGLSSEILRKPVLKKMREGKITYECIVQKHELAGSNLSEVGFFSSDDVLVGMKTFDSFRKDKGYYLKIRIQGEELIVE